MGPHSGIKFNEGDKVRITQGRYAGRTAVMRYVGEDNEYADVTFLDGTKQKQGMVDIRGAQLLGEREILKSDIENAQKARIETRDAFNIADIALSRAQRALADYDEAHREPTPLEKLNALGIGAIIQTSYKWVKMADGNWRNLELIGNEGTYRSERFGSSNYTILFAGVK
jgi:hypothetical protein